MAKYLDSDGLIYVWSKIKAQLNTKVDKVTGKGLSTNDFTTNEKNKLSTVEQNANNYVLPKATTSVLGGVIVGDNLTVDSSGKISAIQGSYTLPIASASTLGGVRVGTNLSINTDGTLSATDTTYSVATTTANGLMSSSDKSKLNGIEAQANKYVHPTHTAKANGFYKVTVDSLGHISSATAVAKSDITALGIPAQDTTYTNATSSQAGLMSASDKAKLDGIDITGIYKYKGSVATVSALPTNASVGDVYNVEADGMNYAWTGTEWDALGSSFSIQSLTNAEIDEICD